MRTMRNNERGASMVEYVLLIGLIAVVCIGALQLLSFQANTQLGNAANALGG